MICSENVRLLSVKRDKNILDIREKRGGKTPFIYKERVTETLIELPGQEADTVDVCISAVLL